MENERIPRMRTVSKIVAEIEAMDPDTEVTEYYIRGLVKSGTISTVWAGNKALINLDDVLDILRVGTSKPQTVTHVSGGIRRIDEKKIR